MIRLFKKKSKVEILNKKYEKLQQEAYKLSKLNRIQSDLKQAEAQEVLEEIESLQKRGK